MFNEPLTKEEYEKRLEQLNLTEDTQRQLVINRVEELRAKHPKIGMHKEMAVIIQWSLYTVT